MEKTALNRSFGVFECVCIGYMWLLDLGPFNGKLEDWVYILGWVIRVL